MSRLSQNVSKNDLKIESILSHFLVKSVFFRCLKNSRKKDAAKSPKVEKMVSKRGSESSPFGVKIGVKTGFANKLLSGVDFSSILEPK